MLYQLSYTPKHRATFLKAFATGRVVYQPPSPAASRSLLDDLHHHA